MKKRTVFITTYILLAASAVFAQDMSLTLNEAVAIALRDNPDILITRQDAEKAKLDIKEAFSETLPQVTATAMKDVTVNLKPDRYYSTQIHAGAEQVFFASGRIANNISYNKYISKVKEALLDKAKMDIALEVKDAFCTLILASELCALNSAIVDNTAGHLDLVSARYEKGQASESDLLSAKASLDNAKKLYNSSLSQAESAQLLLKDLLYIDNSVIIKPVGEFAYEPREIAYDKAFLSAMSKRPEIIQYESQAKADEKAVEVARAGMLPTLYGKADFYAGDRFITETGATLEWSHYEVYGIKASWPLFDGFATQSRIEKAIIDLKNTRVLGEKTKRDIASELKNSYLELKNAITSIEAAESDFSVFKDNLEAVRRKCAQGIASSLDLDDADLKFKISAYNKNAALYDYIVAKAKFEKAAGGA